MENVPVPVGKLVVLKVDITTVATNEPTDSFNRKWCFLLRDAVMHICGKFF